MNERITEGILPSEEMLPDDYPIHWRYLYVCDGKVISSPVGESTVKHLKEIFNIKEIRNCDIAARNLF